MALERRTIKILVIAVVVIIITGGVIGLVLHLKTGPQNERVEIIPMPDPGSSLIHYKHHDKGSVFKVTKVIDDVLDEYHKNPYNLMACSATMGPAGELVCDVPLRDLSPCSTENMYNYLRGAPCVFLRLNKLVNWKPEPYNTTDNLPADMPEHLKQHIAMVSGKPEANMVWVSCEGENVFDVENIGPLQYIPRQGFPSYYFPYNNQEGYLSPLVAVLFERPMTGIVISVECKVWAKNIKHDQANWQLGAGRFELMVDS